MTSDPVRQDPFEGIQWNHELFVWSDPQITAEFITTRLMGKQLHWKLPEYAEFWEKYGHLHHHRAQLEIERKILFDASRPNWGGISKHGKPYYRHMLTMIRLLFPETDITPSLADAVMLFCMGIGGAERKLLNLIGSRNAGKSAAAVRIAFAVMFIDPEFSQVFVANPFDNAADSTVWGDVEELWLQLRNEWPNDTGTGNGDASCLFPWGKLYAAKQLDLVPGIPKCGSIVLRNTKDVGKFKGSKSRGGRNNLHRGVMLLVVDEVNEIKSLAFLTTLTNITSQEAFFGITSQNFKDSEDMGGRLTEPKATFGGPSTFDELDIEHDVFWHSAVASMTLRLDGHRSPNILAGKLIYPRLFNQKDVDFLKENYGEQSPDYFSQARSFPVQDSDANSVLSRAQISASRYHDTLYSMRSVTGRVSFCDPAFGGRDKAVWGCSEFGPAYVTDGESREVESELLVFKEPFKVLQLTKGATYNDFWFDRLKRLGIPLDQFEEGSDVSYEDQIAVQCAELNKAHGVRAENFGYDFSMRPDIVSSINKVIGFSAVAFDYNQGPEGLFLQRFKQQSEDCCKNRVTELAFAVSDVFISKQVRGGANLKAALDQTTRTRYETVNKKFVAEAKKDYKIRWGSSPDMRDVLMGNVGMAFKRGFRRNTIGRASRGSGGSNLWEKLNAGHGGRGKIFKRI